MIEIDNPTLFHYFIIVSASISLTIAFGLLAFFFPRFGESTFRRAESALSRLAARKGLALFVLFLAVIAIRVFVLFRLHVPIPGIHDEFSYLLASDTFAHGRLTNPPHPMWVSFETFHVNWLPTYCSKYPPAQGLALALGQVLGHPWIGVLLSMAAMCAAVLWMLQGWLPARWALLGAALVELKLGIASYWVNSYWGGTVAGIGGALVLGSLARIAKRPRVRHAILLALGVAILANSRPYEGLLFCLPSAAWLFWWFIGRTKSKATLRDRLVNVIVPTTAVLIAAGACMCYYNWRLTGSPLLMPYAVNSRTYTSSGLFLWDRPKPPKHYGNQQLEDFYINFERENYHNNVADALRVSGEKLIRGGLTYFFSGLLLTLPALPFALRDPRMRLPLATIAVSAIAVFVVIWSHAHYAAAITGALYLVIVQAIRRLRLMFNKALPVGIALSRAIVLILILITGTNIVRGVCDSIGWTCKGDVSRVAIDEKLKHMPGKHLIVVRYNEDHNIHDEWVFNGAEIDNAKVVWARELGTEQNAKLFAYFKDRKIWLVTPDTDNTYLETYTAPDVTPSTAP
jgi:hypothetical protein